MKTLQKNITGKSLIFNLLFILVNLIGLTLLVFGYHESYVEQSFWLQLVGYLLFIIGLLGIGIFKGWLMFAYLSRVLVGGLFVVSGLIKANDPNGFAYKLEEYFEDGALAYRVKELIGWETFSLEFLINHALMISIIICVLEIVLGVLVIIGTKIKPTTWLMMGMMVFFTLLTWHTSVCDPNTTFRDVDVYDANSSIAQMKIAEAEYNEDITILKQSESSVRVAEMKRPQCVDDCGCFGDAMKGSVGRSLTPAESFWKDLILLYFVIIIFIVRRKIYPNSVRENTVMIFTSLLFIAFFSWLFTWTFPILFGLLCLLLALWIKRAGGKYLGNDFGSILIITLLSVLFVTYVLMYSPMRDYRPYAKGSDLREKMNDGIDGVYETEFVYTNMETGEDQTFTQEEYNKSKIWEEKELWEWKASNTKTIKEGRLPSITDQFEPSLDVDNITKTERNFPFIDSVLKANQMLHVDVIEKETGERFPQPLEEFYHQDWDTSVYAIGDTLLRLDSYFTGVNLVDYILDEEQIILVISRDLKDGNFSRIQRLKSIAEHAAEHNIPMLMISTAMKDEVEAFREETGLDIPTVLNDETELKAITRSNPTLMVLQKGVVIGKYPFRSTPSWDWLVKNVLNLP